MEGGPFPLAGPSLSEAEVSLFRRMRPHSEWAAVVEGGGLWQGSWSLEGAVDDHWIPSWPEVGVGVRRKHGL